MHPFQMQLSHASARFCIRAGGYLAFWALSSFLAIDQGQAATPERVSEQTVTHRWTEPTPPVSIEVSNPEGAPLAIVSVQSSQGLTVRSYPKEVAGGGRGEILLDVTPVSGAAGGHTQVRVITSRRAEVYSFRHEQEPVAAMEPRTLTWKSGEPLELKTAKLHVAASFVRPSGLVVGGSGAEARLIPGTTKGDYLIEVTPMPSARGSAFSVQVNFDPDIPQLPVALGCSVAP